MNLLYYMGLKEVDSPTDIGRRQQHFDCNISTFLEFSPKEEGEEVGIKKVFIRGRNGFLWKIESEFEYAHDSIILPVQADVKNYI